MSGPAIVCSAVNLEEIRCHRCSYFIGEAPGPLEFVGVVKRARDRGLIELPRHSWVCAKCRWLNIFRSVNNVAGTQGSTGSESR